VSDAGLDVTVNADDLDAATVADLERAVRTTLRAERVDEAEVSLTLLDDGGIRALNVRWLKKDRPTDVIAFSLGGGERVLGDIYVGHEQAERQAAELGVPLREELVRLAIHGTLHVMGHDHPDGSERDQSPMFARQEELVRRVLERDGPV